ncbi:MAG: CehA/McbA family metallohydrolase [Bryobacteraceae bacterium]|nr:CehA/McbA family metallohydrolase [Bryobacteraceae bacterium]
MITSIQIEPFSGTYVVWSEVEFLNGARVVHTAKSPEISGNQPLQTIGLTAAAPEGTTGCRAAIAAQNRFGLLMPARFTAREMSFVTSSPSTERPAFQFESLAPLPVQPGARTVPVVLRTAVPDGTVVNLTATRGTIATAAVVRGGVASTILRYNEKEAGRSTITASLVGATQTAVAADPYAALVHFPAFERDGHSTPALVRFILNGKVLPGRYRQIEGQFLQAPATMEVPPGLWQLHVSAGPHHAPHERQISLSSGQQLDAGRIRLDRKVNLRELGWYGGDPDGDVYHGERIYTDVGAHTAAMISQAVGLDWVTPANWGQPQPRTWREARQTMDALSSPLLLFRWANEKKWLTGHYCFLGIHPPDDEPFDRLWKILNRIEPFEALLALRRLGGGTFANHPVRYWVTNGKFSTNMYSGLPFDLAAAGLIDGFNINEGGERVLELWSFLLDHGFRLAATGGADFALDHPNAWLPGLSRLYVQCPDGLSENCFREAIRSQRTIVSTGPLMTASIDSGLPPGTTVTPGGAHKITVRAWPRFDRVDSIERVELWSHNKVIASKPASEATFDWEPAGNWDWVSARAVSKTGWAMSSAFYAAGPGHRSNEPMSCNVSIELTTQHPATLEVWDNHPEAPESRIIQQQAVRTGQVRLTAPPTSTLRFLSATGKVRDFRLYDLSGVHASMDKIAEGERRDQPLFEWQTYEDVRRKLAEIKFSVNLEN